MERRRQRKGLGKVLRMVHVVFDGNKKRHRPTRLLVRHGMPVVRPLSRPEVVPSAPSAEEPWIGEALTAIEQDDHSNASELLHQPGVCIDIQPTYFRTPLSVRSRDSLLHVALRNSRLQVARVLLQHGARVDLPNSAGGGWRWPWVWGETAADIHGQFVASTVWQMERILWIGYLKDRAGSLWRLPATVFECILDRLGWSEVVQVCSMRRASPWQSPKLSGSHPEDTLDLDAQLNQLSLGHTGTLQHPTVLPNFAQTEVSLERLAQAFCNEHKASTCSNDTKVQKADTLSAASQVLPDA